MFLNQKQMRNFIASLKEKEGKKMEKTFRIHMELEVHGTYITTEETGDDLYTMSLKKDIRGEILKQLKIHKSVAGECEVSLLVEKNGEYYDSDQFTVKTNDDFTDLVFLG